ncbi:hypothetical protein BaRGS_00016679 [Batillaria attramentaria]|uniref:Uncharacterized protein n=1 Tax=Batillaria attramentaria TaxID=370345 RepID=A0ABD0KY45_9CAEN
MILLLLFAVVLISVSHVLSVNHRDFDHPPDENGIEFIYHENHNLLLALFNGSCYVSDVSERGKEIMQTDEAWALVSQ